jgi:hypothetical protein
MDLNPRVLKTYLDHFLPREVIGPFIILFSLRGLIGDIFPHYVPDEYATVGWALIFVFSLLLVAYWGTVDEQAVEELQDRLDEIEEEEATDEQP